MQDLNDIELIREINDGSHQAFEVLVRRYTKYFYAIAYRYTSNQPAAEDITQQAFLKLWEFPHKYDEKKGASFKTWFAHLVVNMSIDYLRKNKNMFEDIEELQVQSNDKDSSSQVYEKQLKQRLEKAIQQLPTTQQTAINLGFYQDIPYEEVAKIMKTTPSAVKSLIMRAKENLRRYMNV